MAHFRHTRFRTWPIVALVAAVTAGAWGVYAWRYAPGTNGEAGDGGTGGLPATMLRANSGEPRGATGGGADAAYRSVGSGGNDPVDIGDVVRINGFGNTAKPGATEAARQAAIAAPPPFGRYEPERVAEAASDYQRGRDALAAGDLVAARLSLTAALDRGLAPDDELFARSEAERISDTLVFSRTVVPGDTLTLAHVIRSGDSLAAIAVRHHVTAGLLTMINNLPDANWIQAGGRLKVVQGPFHAVIDKSDHRMDLYLDEGRVYVCGFNVGLGLNGGTPTGLWGVKDKLVNPEWTNPQTGVRYLADDPDNPIGEHWIGLEGLSGQALGRRGFGIHGTHDPDSIGENVSLGCIRLVADDVAAVFDLLIDGHSRVVIRP